MGDQSDLKEREDKLQGMGTSLLRKEDAKFIRGQGTYIDDIKLPGMLFGAIVRSPYAHARIKGIDKSKALACPGVVAVLTADDLKPVNLHWMPTLGGDVQAVLADKKVCFQLQEVAMVLAAVSLLAENPDPSEDEIRHGLEGNLCRCTGYQNIVAAALDAAKRLQAAR